MLVLRRQKLLRVYLHTYIFTTFQKERSKNQKDKKTTITFKILCCLFLGLAEWPLIFFFNRLADTWNAENQLLCFEEGRGVGGKMVTWTAGGVIGSSRTFRDEIHSSSGKSC